MKARKISILSLALIALLSLSAQAAQLATAKVVEVVGTVTKYSPDGQNNQLQTGDILKEGDSVSVTALSLAKLVFSNGSELTIEENTNVSIAKLQQDAFGGNKSYEQLQADPSKSQTLLELNYGKLNGHVKQLRSDSKFHVNTPLGTAAIRGTVWSMTFIYNAERGEFLLTVKNFDGLVDIISKYVGQFEYGEGNTGDKPYDAGVTEAVRELIPASYTIVIRINVNDPFFDELLYDNKEYIPSGPGPVITPWALDFDDTGAQGRDGRRLRRLLRRAALLRAWLIVVSPEGPGA